MTGRVQDFNCYLLARCDAERLPARETLPALASRVLGLGGYRCRVTGRAECCGPRPLHRRAHAVQAAREAAGELAHRALGLLGHAVLPSAFCVGRRRAPRVGRRGEAVECRVAAVSLRGDEADSGFRARWTLCLAAIRARGRRPSVWARTGGRACGGCRINAGLSVGVGAAACTCFRRHGDVCACGRASAVKALGARSKLARELAACTRFLRASAAQDARLPDPWTTSSAMLGH